MSDTDTEYTHTEAEAEAEVQRERLKARALSGGRARLSRKKDAGTKTPDDVATRAGHLLEQYAGWFAQYRRGAKLRLLASPVDFQEACSLCETWDDAHLARLAKIVLTTDEDFISRTDRSFHIFALKATWADDRLRAAEQGAL